MNELSKPYDEKPVTHRDELRKMSDEELAAFLADHPVMTAFDAANPYHVDWLNWLKKTVT